MIENYGTTNIIQAIQEGTLCATEATYEAIQAWLNAIEQTRSKMTLQSITGEILVEDFQSAYQAVSEKTTSSPLGLSYSIWKVLAREDDITGRLSIMMSMPFMYEFVNKR